MTDKNTELPQDPKTVDANTTEARAAETRAAEMKAAEAKAIEARAAEVKAAEARAAEARAAEIKAAEAKAAEVKAAEAKAAEAKAAEAKAAETKAAQEKAAQEKAAQEKAAQEKAAQEKAAQEKAAQDKAAQEKAAQERAAQAKAAEAKAAEARAAEARAAAAKAAPAVAAASDSTARPAQPPSGNKSVVKKRGSGVAGPVLVIAILVALALAAVLWYQQKRFDDVTAQLQRQATASADAARQAGQQASQAAQRIQQQAGQISSLESSLSDTRQQLDGLQQAFQMVTDSGSELVLLNDIDHLVTIAQQQLQLGGNVANAIISMETAQAQLARANRPGLASLQQTINGDLDRLRAATTVDIALLSSQLDEFAKLVSVAPLITPDDAAPVLTTPPEQGKAAPQTQGQAGAPAADLPWWKRGMATVADWSESAWASVRQDLGAFISVRRVDDEAALLMSPDQATRFRDSLRQRVMTAQLALMMHQPGIWSAETNTLLQSVEKRFDQQSAQTRQAIKLARQFVDTSIAVSLPTVDNSLRAIEALRAERERDGGQPTLPGAGDAGKKGDGSQTPAAQGTKPAPSANGQAAPSKAAPAAPSQGAQPQKAQPASPNNTQPAAPQTTQPAAPQPTQPAAPAATPPAAPQGTQPAAPKNTSPAAPATTQPAAPQTTQPTAPQPTQPTAPQTTPSPAPQGEQPAPRTPANPSSAGVVAPLVALLSLSNQS